MTFRTFRATVLTAALLTAGSGLTFAQTAGQDIKNAGHDTADASKSVAHSTAHGTKKVYHKTATGTKKVVHKTGNGISKVGDKMSGKPE